MKKIWIVGILILIALIPVTSTFGTSGSVNSIPGDNLIIESLDNNEEEIFSKIDGSCLDSSFYGIGVFFNAEIWATSDTWITIVGYTSLLPPRSYTVHTGKYVKSPLFIGYTFQVSPGAQTVHGIAIGDIEWS